METLNLGILPFMGILTLALCCLLIRRTWLTPYGFIVVVFLLAGGFILYPQLITSTGGVILSEQCLILLHTIALSVLLACLFLKRRIPMLPELSGSWRLLPELGWFLLAAALGAADVVMSIVNHGSIGILYSAQRMGVVEVGAYETYSMLTFLAWGASGMCFVALTAQFVTWRGRVLDFIFAKRYAILLLGLAVFFNALGGNRFVVIVKVFTFVCAYAMTRRVRLVWLMPLGAAGLIFFVLVGNLRFGEVDIRRFLEKPTNHNLYDYVRAWLATYGEPILPNVNNLFDHRPEPRFGMNFVTSVNLSEVNNLLGWKRSDSATVFSENELYEFRGFTFRTMYPDLIYDFGVVGGVLVGLLLLIWGAWLYNRAFVSSMALVTYLCVCEALFFIPLLNAFYKNTTLLVFAVLLVFRLPSASAAINRISQSQPQRAATAPAI